MVVMSRHLPVKKEGMPSGRTWFHSGDEQEQVKYRDSFMQEGGHRQ